MNTLRASIEEVRALEEFDKSVARISVQKAKIEQFLYNRIGGAERGTGLSIFYLTRKDLEQLRSMTEELEYLEHQAYSVR